MAISKIIFGDQTLIDLTEDTVSQENLLSGFTAHNSKGELITGTFEPKKLITPYAFDWGSGYVGTISTLDGSIQWKYDANTSTFSDVYKIKKGHIYIGVLGELVGNRWRVMFSTEDVTSAVSDVKGTCITYRKDPQAGECFAYKAADDGYIIITKDNNSKSEIITYFYDITDLLS